MVLIWQIGLWLCSEWSFLIEDYVTMVGMVTEEAHLICLYILLDGVIGSLKVLIRRLFLAVTDETKFKLAILRHPHDYSWALSNPKRSYAYMLINVSHFSTLELSWEIFHRDHENQMTLQGYVLGKMLNADVDVCDPVQRNVSEGAHVEFPIDTRWAQKLKLSKLCFLILRPKGWLKRQFHERKYV